MRHEITVGRGAKSVTRPPDHTMSGDHYILGSVGDTKIDSRAICSGYNQTIKIERKFEDLFLQAITANLYNPTTIEVWCRS